MKYLFRLVAAASAAALFFSCTSDKSASIKTDRAEFSDEITLADGREDLFNIDVKVEYPTSAASDQVLTKINATILEASLGSDYMTYPVKTAVEKYSNDRIKAFKDENLELLEDLKLVEDEEGNHAVDLSWDERIEGYFSGEHNGIISYVVYTYMFDGGAHGQEGEVSVNIEKATGNVVEEDEFFIPGFETRLGGLLSSHLLAALDNDEESYDMLFMKDIQPNGNFKVSSSGITYIYSPYEIGPYALGTIKVNVTWDELGDLVRSKPLD